MYKTTIFDTVNKISDRDVPNWIRRPSHGASFWISMASNPNNSLPSGLGKPVKLCKTL